MSRFELKGEKMSADLTLRSSCSGCGSTSELYGSNCKHMTLCLSCGKTMAENRAKCFECGAIVTRLIREYNVRASTVNDKNYFIGRFVTGLPSFSKKKNAENKWSLHKEGLQGRQLSDTLREKYKNKPWVLEDETGQSQYQGHLEGAQTATYYLLMRQGKEFSAIPAGSWYACLAFLLELFSVCGDDWEHEEIFTDDDEAVGNNPEEREDLELEVPAPPEIKQMDDDIGFPQAAAPKQKDAPKEEPSDNSPSKPVPSGSARGTPSTAKSAKGKRKLSADDAKTSNSAPPKKEQKVSIKEEPASASKSSTPSKGTPSVKAEPTSSSGPVTEEEIRTVLVQRTPVTTQDLVARFKARLRLQEDKTAFAAILRKISKIQKTTNGSSYVVLRDK
ncbi:transcription initiation factor IIF subunit alpha isoform X2 [Prunus yedoensis var. nudiflora]|uniref:Transcription initiation factor IIF subunit alpha n=1 Tax=Prunus yedoensis var. nudiflora TaxID=2094558 RepID=A0A314ZI69_PRUYE|nr:transcription initiation factor IIF subunit alpha isoform X2 [Prunus yedoensis var. nudiflora]